MVFEAPEDGANVSLVAGLGVVSIVNNDTRRVLETRLLRDVSQVIFVGSQTSPDVLNLFIAGARGGLEKGIEVYGGDAVDDVMRLYGTAGRDTFNVDDGVPSLNSNDVTFSGIEKLRLATLGGRDQIAIADDLPFDVLSRFWFDPNDDELPRPRRPRA